MKQSTQITGLIWDLGGLFIQVHPENLAIDGSDQGSDFVKMHHLFECGLCSASEFERSLRQTLTHTGSFVSPVQGASDTRSCWNRILGTWNLEDLDQLQGLRKHYAMVLLSNTNSLHEEAFTASLMEAGGQSLDHYFDRVVFSHHYRMRKPNPKLYESAVHGLKTPGGEEIPMESWLFLDDSQENLDGAASLGLQTCLHPRNTSPMNTLRDYLAPKGLPGTPGS